MGRYFVRYKREFVITVIVITEFDCISFYTQSNSAITNSTGPQKSIFYSREIVITVRVYVVKLPFETQKSGVIFVRYNCYNCDRYSQFDRTILHPLVLKDKKKL